MEMNFNTGYTKVTTMMGKKFNTGYTKVTT